MNEKRFKLDFDNHSQGEIMDRQDKYGQYCRLYDFGEVGRQQIVELLNGQQSTIEQLQEENENLRQMIKENVFQRYREGSLADLEFKAIAYDDIVKVERSNESEPKVIVICKQGKKENVNSFCQMFIPFGVSYEIKEGS